MFGSFPQIAQRSQLPSTNSIPIQLDCDRKFTMTHLLVGGVTETEILQEHNTSTHKYMKIYTSDNCSNGRSLIHRQPKNMQSLLHYIIVKVHGFHGIFPYFGCEESSKIFPRSALTCFKYGVFLVVLIATCSASTSKL